MKRRVHIVLALLVAFAQALPGGEEGRWRPLLILRIGNADAVDADDGRLARFMRGVRYDGRFVSPSRTLIGPEIRNPTFFGLIDGAWIEAALFAPPEPGPLGLVWVFPVVSRDEYMNQFAGRDTFWFDDMDGTTTIRETDAEGKFADWRMEWLPGGLAFFGRDLAPLLAAKHLYSENGAVRGILASTGPAASDPDLTVRIDPGTLAAWRDRDPDRYWWRENVNLLANDLLEFWQPAPPRTRLVRSLADRLALWPLSLERVEFRLWLEEESVEWRLDATGSFRPRGSLSELVAFRRIPTGAALAYAFHIGPEKFAELAADLGRFLLNAAGGAVNFETREAAFALSASMLRAGPRQAAAAWIPPPPNDQAIGAARLLVTEWDSPEALPGLWPILVESARPDSPTTLALAQMGLKVSFESNPAIAGTAEIIVRSSDDASLPPRARLIAALRRNGSWLALAVGPSQTDPEARLAAARYLADLAGQAVDESGPGSPDAREAFTRMGRRGGDIIGFLDPVRFLQAALSNAADWRPRPPDQIEPLENRLAREMLGYNSGGSWSMTGMAGNGVWTIHGGMSWRSLEHLAGALGISEAIGME
ncbi:MAG: hypothetical protein LBE84_00335 [Planctomycetota bacterium]|jgi:hypothetical protein|nr:hypothetical protein [Planctomycetota bacterium]